jgi:hypothetical protein
MFEMMARPPDLAKYEIPPSGEDDDKGSPTPGGQRWSTNLNRNQLCATHQDRATLSSLSRSGFCCSVPSSASCSIRIWPHTSGMGEGHTQLPLRMTLVCVLLQHVRNAIGSGLSTHRAIVGWSRLLGFACPCCEYAFFWLTLTVSLSEGCSRNCLEKMPRAWPTERFNRAMTWDDLSSVRAGADHYSRPWGIHGAV